MNINLIYFLLVLWILTFYHQVRNNIWECVMDIKLIIFNIPVAIYRATKPLPQYIMVPECSRYIFDTYNYQVFRRDDMKLIKWSKDKDGYHVTSLLKDDGSRKYWFFHRLVWECMKYKIPEGYVVHHKDGIKDHNTIKNLSIISRGEHTTKHKTGFKHSQETKNKMSQTQKNRWK